MLLNKAGKSFVDITQSSGTGELHKGHGIAFADLSRQGHEDIVAETGGAVPGDEHAMRVFKNPGTSNDWLNVRLVGVKSNREAAGAQVKVMVRNGVGAPRSLYRVVGQTSSFGANPVEQHIGLGPKAGGVMVDVWWPASGTRQHFAEVEKNEYIQIKEFATSYERLDRAPFHLGGGKAAVEETMPAWKVTESRTARGARVFRWIKRSFLITAIFAAVVAHVWAAEQHAVQGMILKVDREHGAVLVSCDAVPGYMDAMEMRFAVRQPNELNALQPGTTIRFNMVERNHEVFAEHLQPIAGESGEAEPTEAARLTFLHRTLNPAAAAREVPIGGQVSDFTLLDQTQTPTQLTHFRGKVVVLSLPTRVAPTHVIAFDSLITSRFSRKQWSERGPLVYNNTLSPPTCGQSQCRAMGSILSHIIYIKDKLVFLIYLDTH